MSRYILGLMFMSCLAVASDRPANGPQEAPAFYSSVDVQFSNEALRQPVVLQQPGSPMVSNATPVFGFVRPNGHPVLMQAAALHYSLNRQRPTTSSCAPQR